MAVTQNIWKNDSVISGDDVELYLQQRSFVSYDSKKVYQVLPEKDFVEMANINSGTIKRYLQKNPQYARKLSSAVVNGHTKPFVSSRKKKK